ncbi:hypothetical protein [Flavobacterium columnare]|uniref:Uncharacterized protein n=1 Tax=Flavobacterium columnare TaxID=996 RepID=A0AAI8CIS9_9FLAO|nr:hypothetical protein [Flavobacterium columnare]AMO20738.1 hypothetical protein UN65_10670 [Flavobacterium columnare]AUX18719.1 hypothetical protein AQ623_10830 [Flavobacterium columnare]QOG57802.1 hypothetical protein HUE29_10735 [Flavobacterium columnare]QOG60526.1 hypothetical protein HUE30_10735 [Flavobacterium columnare]QOG63246.1 hypothetical protein HUE31_10735 [Flavobacterium columnare]
MGNFEKTLKQLKGLEQDLENLDFKSTQENNFEDFKKILKEEIHSKSLEVFNASDVDNIFWEYCSFSVYKNKYSERLEKLLDDNDKNNMFEETFIEKEINTLNHLILNFTNTNYSSEIKNALDKKLKFLLSKSVIKKNAESIEDYSDTNAKEKIVFLNDLGILEFLWKKYPKLSNNKIAEVLSAITSVKASTIQSYTNPIYAGKNVSQEKNPLTDEELVLKVKMKLTRMKISDK